MIRVLHVVGVMHYGGAEKRLLELARDVDKTRLCFDFCVFNDKKGAYEDEIVKLGFGIIRCKLTKNIFGFIRRFNAVLKEGKYDAVHCHIHQFSGLPLLLAAKQGVPIRIMHIRTGGGDDRSGLLKALWWKLMASWVKRYATKIVANSQSGMVSYMGSQWRTDSRTEIIYGGIDLKPFQASYDKAKVLAEFGITSSSPVVIHVGNFGPAKNHEAIIRIAKTVIDKKDNVRFLLVGNGYLMPHIKKLAAEKKIEQNIHFAGHRNDVPRLLMASDCFLFPSKWEGLPGALLEALAAGLPVIASDIEPNREVAKTSDKVLLVPLKDEGIFAEKINKILSEPQKYKNLACQIPEIFHSDNCIKKTLALYG